MFTTSTISMAATITAAAAWLMEATVSACFEIWSWTTSQCTWLSQLAMDKPFVAVITLAVVSLSWCCLCSCFRQLPPKRKEYHQEFSDDALSSSRRLRKRDKVKRMIGRAHSHLSKRTSSFRFMPPFMGPPQSGAERQVHKEPPLAFLEADILESDTQIPQDVMFLLKSVRVFGHFEKPLFMELCKHVETKFVPAGAILFRPGQVDDSIYVVQNGKLQVFTIEVDGVELPLKEAGPGDSVHSLLSIMDAILGRPSSFKTVAARAVRDTYVLQVRANAFTQFLEENPDSLLRIVQIIMLRLQRVTFLALNQFLGLGHELIKQRTSLPTDLHIHKLKLRTAKITPAHDAVDVPSPEPSHHHPFSKLASADSDSEEGGGVGGVGGRLASLRRDSIDHHDSTGSSDEMNRKGKSVAIDVTQNEQFTHRLLPSQSPEFDNVINQARVDRMEFGGSLPSRANLKQNVPLRYSHFVSLESSEVLDAATKDLVRLFQLKNDALLEGRIQLIEVAANSVLGHEGDLDSCVFFIVSGKLKVLRHASNSTVSEDLLYVACPGEFVGVLSALTGEPSFITVKASVDSHLIAITKTNLYHILSEHPLGVCGLGNDVVRRLSPFVRQMDFALDWMELEAGRALYQQGDASSAAYIILNGRLRSVVKRTDGKKELADEYGRGDIVGVVEVMTKSPLATTVHAIRDTELACLPVDLLNTIKFKKPQVVSRLIQLLGEKILGSYSRLSGSTMPSVAGSDNLSRQMVTNLSTVAVVPTTPQVPLRHFTQHLCSALNSIAPTLRLTSSLLQEELGQAALESVGEYRLQTWLSHQEDIHRIVLYQADSSLTQWTARCIRQADCILLVGNADSRPDSGSMGQTLKQVERISARVRKELVLLHHDSTSHPSGTIQWLNTLGWISAHTHVRCPDSFFSSTGSSQQLDNNRTLPPPPNKHSDFARLARRLTGTSIGLVLGGGGARGLSHIGLIKVLCDAGIPIDMVGGTSIGALAGGLYCEDLDADKVTKRARVFAGKMASYYDKILDLTYPMTSMFTGKAFNRLIYSVFEDKQIEDLWIPYFCVTTDITESKMKVHTAGNLWRYVRASMSLSGYLPPLCDPVDGHLLLDGGYVNNLPADLMAAQGAETIIAVDVGSEDNNDLTNYGDHLSGWWLFWNRLNPFSKKYRVPNMTEIQSRLAYVSCVRQLEVVKADESCHYIRPPIDNVSTLQFGSFDDVVGIGMRHAKTVIGGWAKNAQMSHLLSEKRERRPTMALEPVESGLRRKIPSMHNLAALAAEIPAQRQQSDDGEEEETEEEVSGYWSTPEAGGTTEPDGDGVAPQMVFSDSEV